ncbi:MAG: hypothetical protein QNJ85_17105 [Gammaproteobacteria bacterium]|nr:hypothetical protein [Gammaproteobacteria bacterium]
MFEFNLLAIAFEHRGIDAAFTLVRILTMCTYVAWPVIAFIGIMALAGKPAAGNSRFGELVSSVLFLVLLAYPALFMLWVGFAEEHIAPQAYTAGVSAALLPSLLFVFGIGLLLARRFGSGAKTPAAEADD